MSENKIAIYQPTTLKEISETARMLVDSGYFDDAKSIAQAGTKIMLGAELGFNAVTSLKSIHVIKGKPTIGADLIASRIQSHPKYRYQIKVHNNTCCSIDFFERIDGKWEMVGNSTFDENDAKRAGLFDRDMWKKYPKNMYFSRAITSGQRWYCPDVFEDGGTVYTPDELGVEVDESGAVIEGSYRETTPDKIEDKAPPETVPTLPTWDAELLNALTTLSGLNTDMISAALNAHLNDGDFDFDISNKELFGLATDWLVDSWMDKVKNVPSLVRDIDDDPVWQPYQARAIIQGAAMSYDNAPLTDDDITMLDETIYNIVGYDKIEDAQNALMAIWTFCFPDNRDGRQIIALNKWLQYSDDEGVMHHYPQALEEIGLIIEHWDAYQRMVEGE